MNNIGFIGAGNMAYAIAGATAANLKDTSICIYDIDSSKYSRFERLGATGAESISDLITKCDFIFLSVKPQVFDDVLAKVAACSFEDKIFITIAAGISTAYIKSFLTDAVVVRVMPNTPLMIGFGASAVSFPEGLKQEHRIFIKSIFETAGVCEEIPESKMNEIVAVNGSSPAYIYLFAKAAIDAAVKSGIDENAAKNLFCSTLIGSARMLTESEYSPQQLIDMVCSPGGTTLAAMKVLYDNDFEGIVDKAMAACTQRAYELQK